MPRTFAIVCSTILAWSHLALPSCLPPEPAYVAFRESNAVFIGRVLSANQGKGLDPWVYEIEVAKVWKGRIGEEVKIYSIVPGCAAGYDFRVGQSYLVYANLKEDRLYVYDCSRTMLQEEAREDIITLDRIVADVASQVIVQPPPRLQFSWLAYGVGLATGIGCTCVVILLRRPRSILRGSPPIRHPIPASPATSAPASDSPSIP